MEIKKKVTCTQTSSNELLIKKTLLNGTKEYRLEKVLNVCSERFVALVQLANSESNLVLKFYHTLDGFDENELSIVSKLRQHNSPNILYHIDYGVLSFGYFFVFPFIEHTPPPSTFPDIWYFLEKIALAVDGCHSCDILHCDIKPDNILYSHTGDLWLIDFDSAQKVKEQGDPVLYGTIPYWSPEVCDEDSSANDLPRDMWALGVTIIETVYHTYPFSTLPDSDYIGGNIDRACAETLINSIRKFLNEKQEGDFPWPQLLPPNYFRFSQDHKHLQELLKGLLTFDPKKRMTAKQAVEFIKQVRSTPENEEKITGKHKKQSPETTTKKRKRILEEPEAFLRRGTPSNDRKTPRPNQGMVHNK